MKRLAAALVVLTTVGVMAQNHEGYKTHRGEKMNMTPEQLATLQTKKLTLALDLSEAQQEKIMKAALEEAKYGKEKWETMKAKRQSGEWKKPTSEERFEMKNALLDRKIAYDQKMKDVLTKSQYETWKEMQAKKLKHFKKSMQQRIKAKDTSGL